MKLQKIKVFVADDHQIVIDAIAGILNQHSDRFQLVGTALDGSGVLEYLKLRDIDIVILDINMPGINGLNTLEIIRSEHPKTKVLILTMFDDLKHITEMLRNGADGYILKNKGTQQVIEALTAISEGGEYIPYEVSMVVTKALRHGRELKYTSDKDVILKSITRIESELLGLISLDLSNDEIADRTHVATKTVESRKKNLRGKLNVATDRGLVRFAVENGFALPKH